MSLARFNDKWSPVDYPPDPVSEDGLQMVERQFAVDLPQDYRQAVLQIGLPQPTIALLHSISEHGLNLHSVNDFYLPPQIIEATLGWREAGMPEQLIAFASDPCGNNFCFDANRLREGGADSGAIWFFDHDFDTTEVISPSFDAWIAAFCEVEPVPCDWLG